MARSLEILLFLFSIIFVFGFSSWQAEGMTSEEEEICDQCTTKVNNSISNMKNMLREKEDAMEFKIPKPCTPCIITGASTLVLNKEVCPKKIQDGDNTCFDHEMVFYYPVLNASCTCLLPINPADVAKMMCNQLKNPLEGVECSSGGKPPVDPTLLAKSVPSLDLTSLLSMKECAAMPSIPKLGGGSPPKEAKGEIHGVMKDFNLRLILRSCVNKEDVQTVDIRKDDSKDNFDGKCISDDKNFNAPCTCMLKADFIKKILLILVSTMIPCYGSQKMDGKQNIVQQLVCTEICQDM